MQYLYSVNVMFEEFCVCFNMISTLVTLYLHNHDMTYVINTKEVLCMFMTTVIKCHSLIYDNFNANMTLFEMS